MTTVQDTHAYHNVADLYFEIDCDCEELLDAIGLDYKQSRTTTHRTWSAFD